MCDGFYPRSFWTGVIKIQRKMGKKILYLFIVWLLGLSANSQEIITNPVTETNKTIQQLSAPGINDIMSFQTLNQGINNFSLIQQNGNQNKTFIYQQADPGLGYSNQTYSFQEGNTNEMTVGQIGKGNVLLGFQIGYLSMLSSSNISGLDLESSCILFGNSNVSNDLFSVGERNKLQVSQEGINNGIMAIQQGSDNVIDVGQKGSNNYLTMLQKGTNNSVHGYVQENTSTTNLFETITQEGINLSLLATDISGSKAMGNEFSQSGVNLSLEINNGLINTMGGIEVNQTGRDMKVVIDQFYFSFPMQ